MTGLAAGALAVVRDWPGTTCGTTPTSPASGRRPGHRPVLGGVPDRGDHRPRRRREGRTVPWTGPDGQEGCAIDLLSLPSYGRYQHSFEEMLAAHEELIEALADRVTILDLAGPLEAEAQALYLRLAASPVPLSADDTGAAGPGRGVRRRPAGSGPGPGKPRGHQRCPGPRRRRAAGDHGHRCAAAGVRAVRRGREPAGPAAVPVVAAGVAGRADGRAGPGRRAGHARGGEPARRDVETARGTAAPAPMAAVPPRPGVFAAARGGQRPRSLAARVEESFAAGACSCRGQAAGRRPRDAVAVSGPGDPRRGPGDQAAVMARCRRPPRTPPGGSCSPPGALPEPLAGGAARIFANRNGPPGPPPIPGRRWTPRSSPPCSRSWTTRSPGGSPAPGSSPTPPSRERRCRCQPGRSRPGWGSSPADRSPRSAGSCCGSSPTGASLPPHRLRPVRPVPRRGLGNPRNISWTSLTGRRGTLRGHHRRPRPRRGERVHQHPAHRAGTGIHHPPGPHLLRRRIRRSRGVFFGYMTRDHDQAGSRSNRGPCG